MTKKIFISIAFVSLIFALIILLVYLPRKRSGDLIQQSDFQKEEIYNQVNKAESFSEFWQSFKEAVLNRDFTKVSKLTNFPFIDFYNDIYDPASSLTSKDSNVFKENFDLIFDEYTINAIKNDNYRGYDDNYRASGGDVISAGDYLLLTKSEGRFKDLLFQKINKNYLLVGIQYYE